MITILSSIGLNYFYEIKKANKKLIALFLIIVVVFIIFRLDLFIASLKQPECNIEMKFDEQKILLGQPYKVIMLIKNVGGNPYCDTDYLSTLHAFGGVHIEVENAKILGKRIYSKYTGTSIADKEPLNNISWFEAKFDCLKSLKNANLTFVILPLTTPVRIHYRCWLPNECDLEPPQDLEPKYRAAWRNEKCIKRQPTSGEYCKVDVFAGYTTIQKYFCYSKIID